MAERLGDAVLELRTDDTRLDTGIDSARRKAEGLGDTFDKTSTSVVRSSETMGRSLRATGLELGSFATQVAGGTAAISDIALVLPGVVGFLGDMGGAADKSGGKASLFAGILSGVLGGAIGIVIPIALVLIERLFGIGDAAAKSSPEVDALTASLKKLREERGKPDDVARGEGELNKMRQKRLELSTMLDTENTRGRAGLQARKVARDQITALNAEIAELEKVIGWNDTVMASREKAPAAPTSGGTARGTPRASRTSGGRTPKPEKTTDPRAGINALFATSTDVDRLTERSDAAMEMMLDDWFAIGDSIRAMETESAASLARLSDDLEEVTRVGGEFVDTLFDPRNWNDFGSLGKMVLRQLEQEMIRLAILNPLKNMLFGTNESTASSVGGVLGKVFSGFFADGGLIAPGTFGIVGERGPEPVIGTSRGAMVLPNKTLKSGLGGGGGGMQLSMPISIDATGADAAALGRVQGQLDRLQQLPGQIVTTIADARQRRIL